MKIKFFPHWLKLTAAFILVFTIFAAPVQPTHAQTGDTCIVTSALDDGSGGTLREMLANTACETITFADDYTIMLTSPLAVNRSVSIDGVGHTVVLSGGGFTQVLWVFPEVTFNLRNLSVVDGYVQATDMNVPGGGGILIGFDATANISNVTFRGNRAAATEWNAMFGGGGILSIYSHLTLTDVIFESNSADVFGGGMYNFEGGVVTLTRVNFLNNTAGYGGGGMAATAGLAGVVLEAMDLSLTLTDVVFNGNSAPDSGFGGGLVLYSVNDPPATATLTNVVFGSNTATLAGGLFLAGVATLTNVTFNDNSALGVGSTPGQGGGMFVQLYSGSVMLTNATFSNNSALAAGEQPGLGGAISTVGESGTSVTVQNSIVWNNGDDAIHQFATGPLAISYSDVQGGWAGTGNIDLDPLLVNAANGDLHLMAGSPAVDAGDQTLLPADALDLDSDGDMAEPIPYDLEGNPRVIGGQVDMGAYEAEDQAPVEIAPAITTHPQDQAVLMGETASFGAAASGWPLPTVQWQVSTDGGSTWTDIADASTSPLTFSASLEQNGYQYHAVFTNSQGSATSDPATLTVGKLDATCSVTGWTGVYDGGAHGAGGTCTGVDGAELSGLDLGGSYADAPGGTAHWTFTDVTGNYNDQAGDVGIVINKADATCSVTGWTGPYDNGAHGAGGTCTGVDGAELSGLDLGATFTAVPGGTAHWILADVTGNYNDQAGDVGIVINKADATCLVTGWTGPYDGSAHGASGTCTGVDGAELSGLDLGATFTAVPGGTAHWILADVTGNYNDQSGDVDIVITEPSSAPAANPGGPYLGAINTAISFDGSASSDPDGAPLTYAWTFGDGGAATGAMPSHSYGAAGIYDVCLVVNDGTVDSGPACTLAVLYDPDGGFVTGGGWIDSQPGAYIPDSTLSGKATFGFVSKYKKGAAVPEGNTEFQFHAGGFTFHSTAYQWLVVGGKTNAQFKGLGTVNGAMDPNGNAYKFMLWAGDGTPDTFRIRIWWEDPDGTEYDVYDNGFNQAISGGSIVVHTK